MISRGFPSYNCQFNLAKTCSNLQSEDQTSRAVFCGAVLDLRRREIFPKYSSYANTNLYYLQRWPRWTETDKPSAFISRYYQLDATMDHSFCFNYFLCVRRFLLFCRIRQTRLYFGPYNSKKRLLTTLAANISLALRRLTTMLDTLVWSQARTVSHRWLWRLLLAGLR